MFSSTYAINPILGSYTWYCFASIDATLYASINVTIVPGAPATSTVTVGASWYVGVTKKNVLLPNPMLLLVDSAGNTIRTRIASPPSAVLQYRVLDGNAGKFFTQNLISYANSDGTYDFENVVTQSLFGLDTPLSFFVNGIPPTVVTFRQESCLPRTEYAVKGTTTCAPCPDHGTCDGSTFVRVQSGFWRASTTAVTFYACSPFDACPSNAPCADGYHGTMCSQCTEGWGWSVDRCAPCMGAALNRFFIALIVLGFTIAVYYMGIVTMPITSHVDTLYITTLSKKSSVSVIVKLVVSHLQIVALIPFSKVNLPEWFRQFFLIAQSGSTFNPNLAFVSCEIGDGVVNSVLASIAICPIMVAIFSIVCVGAAFWTARRFSKATYESLYVDTTITSTTNANRVAEYIAKGDEAHVAEVQRSHAQLFGDDLFFATSDNEGGLATSTNPEVSGRMARATSVWFTDIAKTADFSKPTADEVAEQEQDLAKEEAMKTLQSDKDCLNRSIGVFLVRWVNMLCLSTIVILFVMFPTIVELSASLLQCVSLDYGNGNTRSVAVAQPSLECDSDAYAAVQGWVWVVLVFVGFGVPLLNVAFVKVLTKLTCEGKQYIAQDIFFFATGGYSRSMWFWESVSLARKAILVLGVTLIVDLRLQILWCVWLLLLSVWLNITLRPWASSVLSNLELCSLGALATTFGLVELLVIVPDTAANAEARSLIVATVMLVNIVALAVFVAGALWFVKEKSIQLAKDGHPVLSAMFDDTQRAIRHRREDIRLYLANLNEIHARFSVLSELELMVQQVHVQSLERARSSAMVQLGRLAARQGNVSLRIAQGGYYHNEAEKYCQRHDATPKIVERYATRPLRSTIAKLRTTASSSSWATNVLLPASQQRAAVVNPDVRMVVTDAAGSRRTTPTGANAVCEVVADILSRNEDVAERPPSFSEDCCDAVGASTTADHNDEAANVSAAFDDMWELWAYWTSLAESIDGDASSYAGALVESRMAEMFAAEERLLLSVLQLCACLHRDAEVQEISPSHSPLPPE